MKIQNQVLFMAGILFLGGCVSIGTYERNMKQCRKIQAERDQLRSEMGSLEGMKAQLEENLAEQAEKEKELKEELAAKDEKISNIRGTYEDLITELKDDIAGGLVGVSVDGDSLKVALGNKVLFPPGSATLQKKGKNILNSVAKVLKKVEGHNISVEGHSDNIPIRGTLKKRYPSNWELSAYRSGAVVRYLQSGGVPGSVLILKAFAENKPIAGNDTRQGRSQNRRVEISLDKIKPKKNQEG